MLLFGRAPDRFPVVSLDFSVIYFLPTVPWPWGRLSPKEQRRPMNEADNLTTFTCRMSWKSWSLNLLEPSGPHRACYGSPLPFFYCVTCCCPGKRCEYLTSLSFVHNNSFVELEPLRTKPSANVTMVFATEQENGVLLYDGQSEHLAVELFNGRIRVSYDVGNYPVSTMYRHVFSLS